MGGWAVHPGTAFRSRSDKPTYRAQASVILNAGIDMPTVTSAIQYFAGVLASPCPVYAIGVKALSGALLAVAWVSAQPATPRQPRFEDYPATQIYKGKPAPPKIVTAEQRMYRTRIREGVEKGWGVLRDGEEQPGPNFAGDMIVVRWGCGSPCLMMAMVDAVTGDVHTLPLAMKDRSMHDTLALPWLRIGNSVGGNPEVDFRQDSRLMVIKASPDYFKEIPHSYAYYYLWRDHHWTLLRQDSLD